jgi:bifunctional non-homologous end joining protein LigD
MTEAGESEHVVSSGDRVVRLSSPDRVLYPDDGITKGDLFEYYRAVAPAILPHLSDRPFTMKRYPHGIDGEVFFQKQAPKHLPSWIPTRQFRTWPRKGTAGDRTREARTSSNTEPPAVPWRLVDFALVNSAEALLFMVQNNCIDMNAWYSRVDKPHRPDFVLFDLDPPDEPSGFRQAIEVAHLIRELLDEVGLPGYVKTSGADGIHVVAPITRRSTFEQTYAFAEGASRLLEQRHPGLVTTEWLKKKRRGVLVDHRQNGHGKTIASVYSVRPKPGAPVSTPLRWEELDDSVTPRTFGLKEALARIERHGDLFEPVLKEPRPLAPAAKALQALRSDA